MKRKGSLVGDLGLLLFFLFLVVIAGVDSSGLSSILLPIALLCLGAHLLLSPEEAGSRGPLRVRTFPIRGSNVRCVYCHDVGRVWFVCKGCGALFHDECHEELGNCSTLGCRQRHAA